jgi:hypothetical protein
LYQIEQHAERLCHLYVTWERHIFVIPPLRPMPSSWGPSDEDLAKARTNHFSSNLETTPIVGQLDSEDDRDSEESEGEDNEDMDDHVGHLFDLAEVAHFTDIYHVEHDIIDDLGLHDTPNMSPRKRRHL